MIRIGNDNPNTIYIGNKRVALMYLGALRIWEAVRSCFGNGMWINAKPWVNGEGWKN